MTQSQNYNKRQGAVDFAGSVLLHRSMPRRAGDAGGYEHSHIEIRFENPDGFGRRRTRCSAKGEGLTLLKAARGEDRRARPNRRNG